MSKPLGRGLGALLSDKSKEPERPSDLFKVIRGKEREVDELQKIIDSEKADLENLRKKLMIELMLKGKVDKTELFSKEEELNLKVESKTSLLKEIEMLKEEARSYVKVEKTPSMSLERDSGKAASPDEMVTDSGELDMRLIRELMPPALRDATREKSTEEPEEAIPLGTDHERELRDELNRSRQVAEVRREAYGVHPPGEMMVRKRRILRTVAPRKVRILRGTGRTVSGGRDNKMFDMIQSALELVKTGNIKDAREALEGILLEYPEDDEAFYHLGNVYFLEGDMKNARKYLVKATGKNPRSYRAYNNLGVVLRKLDQQEAAIRSFNQALEIEPGYAMAWMNLGSLFMEIEPPLLREASIFLRRALEMQPDLLKAKIRLDECMERLKVS